MEDSPYEVTDMFIVKDTLQCTPKSNTRIALALSDKSPPSMSIFALHVV